MKKKGLIIVSIFLLVFLLSILTAPANEERAIIDINALELGAYQQQWDEDKKVTFQTEGINITIEGKFTKIVMVFRETYGRDVELMFRVPSSYIRESILSNIQTRDNITVTWQVWQNETVISFYLNAYQTATLEVSKTDIFFGEARQAGHNFWNYVEYNGDAAANASEVTIYISKQHPNFEIDNKHMIVQYKTETFGWYYPVEDVTSGDIYYNVDDLGDKYRVITHFKDNNAGDVRVHAFPGASDGVANGESLRGAIANWWLRTTVGAKKILIDWFGNKTPST